MFIGKVLLAYYKNFLNPLFPDSCIYTPSCSAYMGQSIEKYGYLRGIPRGLYRILNCNPFAKGGFDPVKDNFRGKSKWLL